MQLFESFSLLKSKMQAKFKSAVHTMHVKFQSESDKLRLELGLTQTRLQKTKNLLSEREATIHLLEASNDDLKVKFNQVKKSWLLLQSTSSNIAKVQKLIASYKKIKLEVLELRKKCDCSLNDYELLQNENNKIRILLNQASEDGQVDINSLLNTMEQLRKENASLRIKYEQLETLIKTIKKNEQKLVNTIKARQILS